MVKILISICTYTSSESEKMSKENTINISKQSLPQLQELLERQHALIQNRKLLEHLKDKGESVVRLYDKIQKEIQYRKDLENVEASVSAITLSTNNTDFHKEKHIEYVCSKEKPISDTRYRPHRTLVVHKETKTPTKSPKKFTEITSALEPKLMHDGGVKCISLSESLDIESNQALRVMEEKAKKALSNLNDMVAGSDDDSDDEKEEDLENEIVHEES